MPKIVESLFPIGTKRKHYLTIAGKTLRLVLKDGLWDFFQRLKTVYGLRRVHYAVSHDISMYDVTQYRDSGRTVDIIVPVYNSFETTKECLNSVFSCTVDISYRVIVIDDASTEPELKEYLYHLISYQENIIMLRNDENLGFVKSVNRAVIYSARDVVILNSDAYVTRDWLRKMHACAYSDENIATVTPISNNLDTYAGAGLGKYNNKFPQNYSVQEFANVVEKSAVESGLAYHEIPVGIGTCMYIKRGVFNEIGVLDEAFGRGHGEEIDFCIRASKRGYYHVLCPFVFIYHVGTASFRTQPTELIAKNTDFLIKRYPDYRERISAFIIRNPLLPIQKAIYRNMITIK